VGEVAQHVEVLGVHMTVEQYRRCEILLENIRADLNVIAEQSCTIIERLDRFLSKLERFERTEPRSTGSNHRAATCDHAGDAPRFRQLDLRCDRIC